MGKVKYLFFVLFLGVLFLVCPQKVQAATAGDIVINEVMWMGSSRSTSDEWIELYNMTNQKIYLSGWQIKYMDSSGIEQPMLMIKPGKFIRPDDYFLISNYGIGSSSILNINPDLVDTAVMLSNSKFQIKLFDSLGNLIDIAGSGGDPLAGSNATPKASMERNDVIGDGTLATSWHTATTSLNFIAGVADKGTPERSHNQAPVIQILGPEEGQTFVRGSEVSFSWNAQDPDNDPLYFQLTLDCSANFDENPVKIENISENSYLLDSKNLVEDLGDCGNYYWILTASDGDLTDSSLARSLKIVEPTYSDAILINELYPDPASGDEWIELFNNSNENVDLKDWILEDFGLDQYKIDSSLIIPSDGFVTILHQDSKITLNNNSDTIKLFDPNGKLVSSTPAYLDGDKGWSFARNPSGAWQWTTTVTPGALNIFTLPIIEDAGGESDEEEIKIPINDEPIDIKTGDIENYRDYLIKISGEITRTSGNTFYIDDGSGEIKVYIQDKTGIDKPPMHVGDIFEIIGIVNLYRGVWRILPRNQDDIKLIQAAEKESSTTSAKSSTAKKTSSATKSTNSNANARAPTAIKQVKAAENQNDTPGVSKNEGSSFWINFVKMLVGLAIILLIVFVLKMRSVKRQKPIGADFGDDLT